MPILVSQPAPGFKAKAVMPDNGIKEFNFHDYIKGKHTILFFYPMDFTFVCPTEIIGLNDALEELASRDTKIVAVSTDSHFSHLAWKDTPIEEGGIGQVQFPIVSDITKSISRDYDVLFDESVALRATFAIDKAGVVRHQLVNDLPIGRSIDEVLRVIDAIQYHEANGEVCPLNWRKGSKAVKPTTAGVAEYLTEHAKEKKNKSDNAN